MCGNHRAPSASTVSTQLLTQSPASGFEERMNSTSGISKPILFCQYSVHPIHCCHIVFLSNWNADDVSPITFRMNSELLSLVCKTLQDRRLICSSSLTPSPTFHTVLSLPFMCCSLSYLWAVACAKPAMCSMFSSFLHWKFLLILFIHQGHDMLPLPGSLLLILSPHPTLVWPHSSPL